MTWLTNWQGGRALIKVVVVYYTVSIFKWCSHAHTSLFLFSQMWPYLRVQHSDNSTCLPLLSSISIWNSWVLFFLSSIASFVGTLTCQAPFYFSLIIIIIVVVAPITQANALAICECVCLLALYSSDWLCGGTTDFFVCLQKCVA